MGKIRVIAFSTFEEFLEVFEKARGMPYIKKQIEGKRSV